MNILDLKRRLWPLIGFRYDGDSPGSSSGDSRSGNSPGGNSIGGGGGWTGNRSERDARDNGNKAAGNPDGGPAGFSTNNESLGLSTDPVSTPAPAPSNPAPSVPAQDDPTPSPIAPTREAFSPAKDSQIANRAMGTETRNDAKAAVAAGNPNQTGLNPNNPSQTAAQISASATAEGFLGQAVNVGLSMAGPLGMGFQTGMNAVKAYSQGDVKGFIGGMVGGYLGGQLGLPGASSALSGVGASLARGETPNYGAALGSLAGGAAGGAVSGAVSGPVGQMAGSFVGNKVNSAVRGAVK